MNPFSKILQEASDRLQIPEPSKSRILLEMASDLQDSYELYLSQGLDEAEAARKARETFGTSDEALKHLVHIHSSGLGSTADRLSGQVGTWWEKVLLVVLLLFEAFLALRVLSQEEFFRFVSPFVWPIAGLALIAVLLVVWKLRQIFSSSGTDAKHLRTGLGTLVFCAGASLVIAGSGFLFHLQRFFRANAETAPESVFMNFAGWMIGVSSMMTIGLLTAILVALVWFVLSGLVARAERRQIAALLEA